LPFATVSRRVRFSALPLAFRPLPATLPGPDDAPSAAERDFRTRRDEGAPFFPPERGRFGLAAAAEDVGAASADFAPTRGFVSRSATSRAT